MQNTPQLGKLIKHVWEEEVEHPTRVCLLTAPTVYRKGRISLCGESSSPPKYTEVNCWINFKSETNLPEIVQ